MFSTSGKEIPKQGSVEESLEGDGVRGVDEIQLGTGVVGLYDISTE